MSEIRIELLDEDVCPGTFDCGNSEINKNVEESYYATLTQQAYAYKILYGDTIVGYYMISLRDVEAVYCDDSISDYLDGNFSEKIYSFFINYLAIDKKYQKMKIGTNILRMIIKQVRESITDLIPIRLITIDAVSDKVDWYTKEGFLKMEEALPGQKGYNEYMYIDCIKNKEKLLEYVEEYC